MITGQNGILNQATKAKEETEKASIEEKSVYGLECSKIYRVYKF